MVNFDISQFRGFAKINVTNITLIELCHYITLISFKLTAGDVFSWFKSFTTSFDAYQKLNYCNLTCRPFAFSYNRIYFIRSSMYIYMYWVHIHVLIYSQQAVSQIKLTECNCKFYLCRKSNTWVGFFRL